MRPFLLISLIAIVRCTAAAQEPPRAAPLAEPGQDVAERHRSFAASRTPTPPKVDGKLDDPAWLAAPVERRFIQNFPVERVAPSQRTELRVLYDDDALYIGVRCNDSEADRIV